MDESKNVTEQLCDFIAKRGVARSADIYEAFPHIGTNLHGTLKNPLGNGYLVSCKVIAPDRRGVTRETLASPRSPFAKDRIERAEAGSDTLAMHLNRPAVQRTTAPQPEVGKNTGSAGLVTPTSAPFAEACSVAPTPAAERANATAAGGDEITATWCLHCDGSMQLAKGGVSLTLAPAEALRFAQLCGLVTPYLTDIRPGSGTH